MAEFPPNLGFQQRVDAGLLGQCIRIEQTQGMILDVRLRPEERTAQQPRRHAGGTVVVERFFQTSRVEERNFVIPEGARRCGEPSAERAIDGFETLVRTDAEKFEQVAEVPAADEREF